MISSKILKKGKENVSVMFDISMDSTFVNAMDMRGYVLRNTDG